MVSYDRGPDQLDALRLDAREEFRITASVDSGPLQFVRIGRVVADRVGQFYVLDIGQRRLMRLSSNGEFDRIVARGGEGPGELGSGRLTLLLGRADSVVVVDTGNQRWHLYGPDGSFVRGVPFESGTDPDVAWGMTGSGQLLKQVKTVIVDSATAARAKNAIMLVPPVAGQSSGLISLALGDLLDMRGGLAAARTVIFGAEDVWAAVGEDRVVVANSGRYGFRVYDTTGRLETVFSLRPEPRPITETDRNEYLALMKAALEAQLARSPQPNAPQLIERMLQNTTLADHYPAFRSFAEGPSGTIMVQRFRTLGDLRSSGSPIDLEAIQSGSRIWDLFQIDGTYVGPVELPPEFRPTHAGEGTLLGVSQDSLGAPMIMRLHVTVPQGN
jgi:hypothetical protein